MNIPIAFNLLFANITISSGFFHHHFFFFLIIDLHFLILIRIAQTFNPIGGSIIPKGMPTNEATEKTGKHKLKKIRMQDNLKSYASFYAS